MFSRFLFYFIFISFICFSFYHSLRYVVSFHCHSIAIPLAGSACLVGWLAGWLADYIYIGSLVWPPYLSSTFFTISTYTFFSFCSLHWPNRYKCTYQRKWWCLCILRYSAIEIEYIITYQSWIRPPFDHYLHQFYYVVALSSFRAHHIHT